MNEGPRLAILAPDLQQGGSVGAVAWRHAIELSGYRPVVAIADHVPAPPAAGRIEVRALTARRWTWMRRFSHVPRELSLALGARAALARACAAHPVGAVWCHSHALAALAALPLRRRFGFKVILTSHGDIYDRPAGTYPASLTAFYRAVSGPAHRGCDAVQALSPYMAERAGLRGTPRDRIFIVPNGIDATDIGLPEPRPRRADTFLPHGRLRILYVGQLWRPKGPHLLLDAVASLAATSRGGGWSLCMLGSGPDEAALRAQSAALGLDGQVRFAGVAPRASLVRWMDDADVLCVPSTSDALPTVVLEAMAAGLPVVGTQTGGIPFMVEHGVTGLLAAPGDAAGLADRLVQAGNSASALERFSVAAHRVLQSRFLWPRIGEELAAHLP